MDLTKKQSHYIDIKGAIGFVRIIITIMMVMVGSKFLFESSSVLFASFFYFLGASTILIRDGVQVDIGLRKIRVYTSFYGFRHGKWVSLDHFKGIVVSDVILQPRKGAASKVTRIFLSSFNVYKQQSIILGEDSNHQHAVLKAKEIGRQLKLEVKVNKLQKR